MQGVQFDDASPLPSIEEALDDLMRRTLALSRKRMGPALSDLEQVLRRALGPERGRSTTPSVLALRAAMSDVRALRRADRRASAAAQATLRRSWPAARRVLCQLGSVNNTLKLKLPDVPGFFERTPRPDGGHWVDLGSAGGVSLSALAALHPNVTFTGVDLSRSVTVDRVAENAAEFPRTPPEPRRVWLEPADADVLHDMTVRRLGAACASVVSLLYPIHLAQRSRDGRTTLAVCRQLDTALELLEPGGRGWLVTEDAVALRQSVRLLSDDPRCDSLDVVEQPVPARQLVAAGVHPYQAYLHEVCPVSPGSPEVSLGPMRWGLVVTFLRD